MLSQEEIYKDDDSARKEEINSLAGADPIQ